MVIRNSVFALLLFFSFAVAGQVSIPGNYLLEFDKHSDTTNLAFYPSVENSEINDGISLVDPLMKFSFNRRYPRSLNDGPVWKGKGVTTEIHFGIAGKKGKLTYVLNPTIFYSQNVKFSLVDTINPSRNIYNYQFNSNIDWVQRYGDKSFLFFHPGQSEISLNFNKISFAVSTQNYSVGPSNFNPIILSRNAGGFPHFKVEFDDSNLKILKKDIGHIQMQMLYGLLNESKYYDTISNNDLRYINAFFIAYKPSFLKELTLGFNRVMYKNETFFKTQDLLAPFINLDDGSRPNQPNVPNDTFDGLASITMNWNFTEVGFRAYLEYARNDFAGGVRNILLEPDGGQRAYTLGFEKIIKPDSDKELIFQYEHTTLSRGPVILYRNADQTYYTHYINRQGYTNNGQIIGAGIGPGSTSDNFGLKLKRNEYSIGFLLQRIESNRDYFNENVQAVYLHDQEYTFQINSVVKRNSFDLLTEIGYSYNFNRYYINDSKNLFFAFGALLRINDL